MFQLDPVFNVYSVRCVIFFLSCCSHHRCCCCFLFSISSYSSSCFPHHYRRHRHCHRRRRRRQCYRILLALDFYLSLIFAEIFRLIFKFLIIIIECEEQIRFDNAVFFLVRFASLPPPPLWHIHETAWWLHNI